MIVVIDDAHHGVGGTINCIHMSCWFSLRRNEFASTEKCAEMLNVLCKSIMERVYGTYKPGLPFETEASSPGLCLGENWCGHHG
jgi:hypothetical protein